MAELIHARFNTLQRTYNPMQDKGPAVITCSLLLHLYTYIGRTLCIVICLPACVSVVCVCVLCVCLCACMRACIVSECVCVCVCVCV